MELYRVVPFDQDSFTSQRNTEKRFLLKKVSTLNITVFMNNYGHLPFSTLIWKYCKKDSA